MDHAELTNQRVHAIAWANGCTIDDVKAALDHHPLSLIATPI